MEPEADVFCAEGVDELIVFGACVALTICRGSQCNNVRI